MSEGYLRKLVTFFGFEVDHAGLARGRQAVESVNGQLRQQAAIATATASRLHGLALRYIGLGTAVAGIRSIFSINAEFQSLSASMETVEGGAEAAGRAMRTIDDFASSTPFELNELTTAWINLRGVGIEPTTEMLTHLGDIASARGRSIVDMSEAVTGALTGEFERLKAFGIIARAEGDNVRFIFDGVEETVARDSESITGYLGRLSETRFGGGMARQMATLRGQMSNLRDGFSRFVRAVGEAGVNEELSRILAELLALFQGGGNGVRDFAAVVRTALRAVAEVLEWVRRNAAFVRVALLSLGAAALAAGIWRLIGLFSTLSVSVAAVPALIIATVILIGLLIDDLIRFANGQDSLLGRLIDRYGELDGWFPVLLRSVGSFATGAVAAMESLLGVVDRTKMAVRELAGELEREGVLETLRHALIGAITEWSGSVDAVYEGESGADYVDRSGAVFASPEMRARAEADAARFMGFAQAGAIDATAPRQGGGSSVTVNQSNTIQVTAPPGSTPEETGRRVGSGLEAEGRRALQTVAVGP